VHVDSKRKDLAKDLSKCSRLDGPIENSLWLVNVQILVHCNSVLLHFRRKTVERERERERERPAEGSKHKKCSNFSVTVSSSLQCGNIKGMNAIVGYFLQWHPKYFISH